MYLQLTRSIICPPVHLSCSCGLIILVSLGIALPAQSGWAVLWIIASMLILLGAWQRRRAAVQQPIPELPSAPAVTAAANQHYQHTTNDVESAGKQQRCSAQACSCSKAGWRRRCSGCGSCLAWSPLFWGAVLELFLVIQAANLAHDKMAFPPPGQLVEVGLDGGKCTWVMLAAVMDTLVADVSMAGLLQLLAAKASMVLSDSSHFEHSSSYSKYGTIRALMCDAAVADVHAVAFKLHNFCSGPITPGLATFILEEGAGSPGITMAGKQCSAGLHTGAYGSRGRLSPVSSLQEREWRSICHKSHPRCWHTV